MVWIRDLSGVGAAALWHHTEQSGWEQRRGGRRTTVGMEIRLAMASSSLVLPTKASMPAAAMRPTTSCTSLVRARCACTASCAPASVHKPHLSSHQPD